MTKTQKRELVLFVWACVSGAGLVLSSPPQIIHSGLDIAYAVLWACFLVSTVVSAMIAAISGLIYVATKMRDLYYEVRYEGKTTRNPLIRFLVWVNTDD